MTFYDRKLNLLLDSFYISFLMQWWRETITKIENDMFTFSFQIIWKWIWRKTYNIVVHKFGYGQFGNFPFASDTYEHNRQNKKIVSIILLTNGRIKLLEMNFEGNGSNGILETDVVYN